MEKIKFSLSVVALVFLVVVLAPSVARAQDGGLPPCCDYSPAGHGPLIDGMSSSMALAGNGAPVSLNSKGIATQLIAGSFERQARQVQAVPGVFAVLPARGDEPSMDVPRYEIFKCRPLSELNRGQA